MVSAASSQEERPSQFLLRRFLKLLMTTLICLYLLICLALWLGQGHLIFFPSKELTIIRRTITLPMKTFQFPAPTANSRDGGCRRSKPAQEYYCIFMGTAEI
jgi:hypothetical protein